MTRPEPALQFASAFDPVLMLDTEGVVLHDNSLARALLTGGTSLVGQRLEDLLLTDPGGEVAALLAAVRLGAAPVSAHLALRDGRFLNLQAVPLASGVGVQLRDTTDTQQQLHRGRVLLELTSRLAGTYTTQEVVQTVLDRGAGVLGASAASVFRLSADEETLELVGSVGSEPALLDRWRHLRMDLATPITDAVRHRRFIFLSAEEADARYPELAAVRRPGTLSLVSLPLIFGDRLQGGLTFSLPHAPQVSLADQRFLQALSQMCAQAFERAQLYEAQRAELLERQRAEQALQAERARLEAVLDQLPVAVWIAELPTGRLIAGNRAIGQILRHPFLPSENVEAYEDYQGVHPDGRPYAAQEWPLARTVIGGETVNDEAVEMTRGDGSRAVVSFSSALIRDPDGQPLYAVVTGTDVTERRQAEAQVLAWNEDLERQVATRTAELQASNGELDAFSYSVSHDLRRPVRHIVSFAGLLRRRLQARAAALNPDETALLETIEGSAATMNTMIDALLAFARLSGQAVSLTDVPLDRLVAEVQRQLAPDLLDWQIEWTVPALPTVRADRTLLGLVLLNLLGNAVKYTGTRATARIEVRARQQEDETVVSVQDNGVGFNEAYGHRLFGMFQRLHSDREFEGIGIGLANVKRIVSKHGGRVWAESVPGAGATFSFSLPLQPESGS